MHKLDIYWAQNLITLLLCYMMEEKQRCKLWNLSVINGALILLFTVKQGQDEDENKNAVYEHKGT